MRIIGHASNVISRVCRATLQSETHALSAGVEEAVQIRAAIADARERLTLTSRWEQTAAELMLNVWMVDCQSLSDHLTNPTFSKCSDKRLSIDLAALRQTLWMTPDQTLRGELTPDGSDVVIWIDASCMLADCLAKQTKADRLREAVDNGIVDLRPTDASLLLNMTKQKGRTAAMPEGIGDLGEENHECETNWHVVLRLAFSPRASAFVCPKGP